LVEDGWPRSRETSGLARRISAVNWFRRATTSRDPTHRIAHALGEHASLLGVPSPGTVDVLRPREGRAEIRGQQIDVSRPVWDTALRGPFDRLRTTLLQSGRTRGHALVLPSGDALLMRPDALPLSQGTLWSRLEGPADDRVSEAVLRILIDRILWELGMMLAWEMVGDLIGPNPYAPLLVIYEEGLYPLEAAANRVRLWAPG